MLHARFATKTLQSDLALLLCARGVRHGDTPCLRVPTASWEHLRVRPPCDDVQRPHATAPPVHLHHACGNGRWASHMPNTSHVRSTSTLKREILECTAPYQIEQILWAWDVRGGHLDLLPR
eukprot:7377796-Prymnesium_polylepis.2